MMSTYKTFSELASIQFKKTTKLRLGINYTFSVGGFGDVRQNAVHFQRYNIEGNYAVPEFEASEVSSWDVESELSGQDILVSLQNLYEAINRPGVSELSYEELIVQWCEQNLQPYHHREIITSIYAIPSALEDKVANETQGDFVATAALLDKEGYFPYRAVVEASAFEFSDFLHDLKTLCQAFLAYLIIAAHEQRDSATLQSLIYEGKLFSAPSFHRSFLNKEGKPDLERHLSPDDLEDFADMFPPMKVKLQYLSDDGITVLAPVVNSVFDSGWYALSCMAAAAESEGYGRGRYRFIRCKCCNKLISAYGQQKYCQNAECQAFRNSQKMQAHRSRKKKQATD